MKLITSGLAWKTTLVFLLSGFGTGLAAAPELSIKGQWQQGGTLIGKVAPGSAVKLDGRALRVSPEGDFIFGLTRDADPAVVLEVVKPDGATLVETYSVARREYNVQKIEGVEQKHVTPPKEVLDRIARENARIGKARQRDDPRTDFLEPFIWPLTGPITGVYGSQRVYNGVPRSPHYGLDIAAPTGTRVVAPAPGIVTLAEKDIYYSGGTLIIDHGHGFSSTFIHLHKLLVEEGDSVSQGQAVAEVGATGRATGPHLDWRLNWFGARMDPALFMADIPMPD